jgi:hypothetical protein
LTDGYVPVNIAEDARIDRLQMSVRTIFAAGFLLLGLVAASVIAAQTTGEQKPPNIYIDKGACPFECCTYREWVARTDVTLLDSPNGKRVVGQVKKGQKVLALTGETHSVPLRFIARYDYPDAGVKAGDAVYLLHYLGEGHWKAWRDGKLFEMAASPDKDSRPKTTWWVKLKTSSGAIGWTIEHHNFDNQDACG